MNNDETILAGDIGGTKTVLALFPLHKGTNGDALREIRYESRKYKSLEAIIAEFLRETQAAPVAASFGVAGPVHNQQAQITNLPWIISAETIKNTFTIPEVSLLNDLQAIAVAIPHLPANGLGTINQGHPVPHGNIVVIAPGTGLGVSFLVWTGTDYKACASEGGHASFSPRNTQEIELLKYLQGHYDHVSFERVCSGAFLTNIYDFLKIHEGYPEPSWLRQELEQSDDRTPPLINAALAGKAAICEITLDIFVHILGTMIGNLAVTFLPTGGTYLGGGIPPRILDRLRQPDFINAITDKGRFSTLLAGMPVHVILDSKTGLYGAAQSALKTLG